MVNAARRPGDGPRQAQAIFTATLELLAERGYDGLTMEGVAARSGVHKTTIYRWWTDKDALLGAALLNSALLELPAPDTGTLRGDLLALTGHVLRLLTTEPSASVITAALTAAGRPVLSRLAHEFFADRLAGELVIFDRARQRGEIAADIDPKLVVDLLAGAMWTRVLLRQEQPPPGFAAQAVDLVLTALGWSG
ncbi:TetR/AcrR family transcriptional regulator [Crossiella cryophila]|uniref:AcrR family transcriptional regulator n=1 Tax=Crossiella cryophila TaxID=43355 RepID=A0A7W7C7T7_9PSEU|nr:TetR/AcrR family transcriptional regulator [Crossiella cryophila]MBB4674809.1 AcrR family transcriptional regulator [Crossiella cryophila]